MIAITLFAFWNIHNMSIHSGLNLNNQTIMCGDDPLFKFNDINFYRALELYNSSNTLGNFNQNLNYQSRLNSNDLWDQGNDKH